MMPSCTGISARVECGWFQMNCASNATSAASATTPAARMRSIPIGTPSRRRTMAASSTMKTTVANVTTTMLVAIWPTSTSVPSLPPRP